MHLLILHLFAQNPPQYLNAIGRITSKLNLDENFVKMTFLNNVLESIKTSLVAHAQSMNTVDEICDLANTLLSYKNTDSYTSLVSTISSTSATPNRNNQNRNSSNSYSNNGASRNYYNNNGRENRAQTNGQFLKKCNPI